MHMYVPSISISYKELLKLIPNSIFSLMRSTNVPYKSSQKRARTCLPDLETEYPLEVLCRGPQFPGCRLRVRLVFIHLWRSFITNSNGN